MRQEQSGKRNVAWFTLAECVSRGEKERALGVYRLLSHSLEDAAVIAQLEGDLLWAFNDTTALEKYFIAATRYQHDGRYREAFAVLEHSRALAPTSRHCLERLIELAALIHYEKRLVEYMREYIDRVDDQASYLFACATLAQQKNVDGNQFFLLKNALLLRASVLTLLSHEDVILLLQEVAAACLASHDERQLQRLLVSLEQNNGFYHQQLLSYLADRR